MATLFVALALVATISLAIAATFRKSRKGHSCGGCSGCSGCSGCPSKSDCPSAGKRQ